MGDLTRDEVTEAASLAIGDRIRHAVKAVLEQILDEEMTQHVGAARRERVPTRTGERNGSYGRDLITPVGKIEQLRVPRDRDGTFTSQVFEEYHRSTGAAPARSRTRFWRCGCKGSASARLLK
jgi:transposase-like protein